MNPQNILERNNLKLTRARVEVLGCLLSHKEPVATPTIIDHLKEKKVTSDQATIFRTINSLKEKGIVNQYQFNDGVVRYEIADKPEHHHAVCIKCNSVEDILDCSVGKIEKQISEKKGFTVLNHSLEFFGICKNCKK